MRQVIEWLPSSFHNLWETLPLDKVEEIRIRSYQPVEVILTNDVLFLEELMMTPLQIEHLFQKLAHYSIYAFEEELKHGYLTIAGGHRVGFAGQPMIDQQKIQTFRFISSLNIRIAKEKIGIAQSFLPYVYQNQPYSTLLIGPPQVGKTTLLRDFVRLFSQGNQAQPSLKVAVVDERSEICACVKGLPSFSFGPRLDVLDGCPKAEGVMLFIRAMSPDIIIVDEIGREADVEALLEGMNAGVSFMATAHGRTLEDVCRRPSFMSLMDERLFERYIVLHRIRDVFSATIYNESFEKITKVYFQKW